MHEFEFDVDASIAAGWDRFADQLAGLLRALAPGGTFDLTVPVLGQPTAQTPYLRFKCHEAGLIHAEVSGVGSGEVLVPLRPDQLDQLTDLGWTPAQGLDRPAGTTSVTVSSTTAQARETAHLVAGTMERVFGIPHPVFLNDVTGPQHPDASCATSADTGSEPEDMDFRPHPISCPDEATLAVGTALAQVFDREVPADENDVFTVPAGSVLLFIRAHRSLPLIVFRSPLISSVEDVGAAETEVAILNRDSLWCRYVFDGESVYAESEFVDRVFLPVNFKIQLAEVSAELDDIYEDLARRVSGKRWRDLRAVDDHHPGEQ